MPKIYGHIVSPHVQRAVLAAYELDINITIEFIDIRTGAHKTPEYLAKNPFGEIPVYEDEHGVIVFESRAIARYLDAKSGSILSKIADHTLYGQVEQWAGVEQSQFATAVSPLIFELYVKPKFRGLESDVKAAEQHKEKVNKVLDIYEKHFTKNHYFAGSEYSLADVFHAPQAAALFKFVYPEALETRPHLKAWFERISARPAFQKVAKDINEALAAFAKK